MPEIYRLRLSKGTQNSHVPDWRLYESRDSFEHDLMDAMLEAESRAYRSKMTDAEHYLVKIWHRLRGTGNSDAFGINKIVGAEQLIDDEWVDLKPRLVPPRIEFDNGE